METINLINFSGGRTSAYMTKRLLEETNEKYLICFQNTGRESKETLDFINECDKRWGLGIVWVEYRHPSEVKERFEVVTYETASRNGEPFEALLKQRPASIPNVQFRYCTLELKIRTVKRYLKSLGVKDYMSFNGIRYDEPKRWSKIKNNEEFDVDLPLVGWKVTKADVMNFWKSQEFDLGINDPYGNCDGCFLKGKGKLIQILKDNPSALDWWIGIENKTGNTFKKEITYQKLKDMSKESKADLFTEDPSFDCFCNAD
jgi:3'-phosphoadenosine 5'-phosphosulfate sulfotransferase (PAPS reductase)/FAD synthetase